VNDYTCHDMRNNQHRAQPRDADNICSSTETSLQLNRDKSLEYLLGIYYLSLGPCRRCCLNLVLGIPTHEAPPYGERQGCEHQNQTYARRELIQCHWTFFSVGITHFLSMPRAFTARPWHSGSLNLDPAEIRVFFIIMR
jgi:hypothetical protein